jgi:hypothetical protein
MGVISELVQHTRQLREHLKQTHQFKPGIVSTWTLPTAEQVHELDHAIRKSHRHPWERQPN